MRWPRSRPGCAGTVAALRCRRGARWAPASRNPRLRRTAFFLLALESSPDLARAVAEALQAALAGTEAAATLADIGDHAGRGFLGELVHRLVSRVLPRPREDHDLGGLLLRLFPDDEARRWLRDLSPAWFERLAAATSPGEGTLAWRALHREAATALTLLATRVAAQGMDARLWRLAPTAALEQSPFLRLSRAAGAGTADPAAVAEFVATIEACRAEVDAIEQRLEDTGVTVGIVHAIASLREGLDRLSALAAVFAPDPATAVESARVLVLQVVDALHERTSIRRLCGDDLRLLARRIVERHGDTGEHYIARDRREYRGMWGAALGGGLVTTVTAALKLMIVKLHLAPLPEGLLAGLNYAGSFLFIQSMHFALATKQPSMTGARLAAIVSKTGGRQRVDQLADHFADTVRTQLAAALGNIVAVSAGAFALDAILRLALGHALLDPAKAHSVLADLNPWASGTIVFAALTGVILWASGLIGGWFENWIVAHRLPEAIAQHPLGRRLGRARLERWGAALGRNAAAWGGSIALGMLLGLTPELGRVIGIPLDVRHVTLSTGMLAFAASAASPTVDAIPWVEIGWAALGIALIFVLNLAVSFLLALGLALRAHGVPMFETLRLGRKIVGRFAHDPWAFLGPPKA